MPPGPFDVAVRREPGCLVVAPSGELDISTVEQVRGVLADRAKGEDLELDLAGLRFMDTSGLQLVVELHREAARDGYRLTLRRPTANVLRVFEMAGLDRVLPFA